MGGSVAGESLASCLLGASSLRSKLRISLGLKPLDLTSKDKTKEAEEKYEEHQREQRAQQAADAAREKIEKYACMCANDGRR